MDKYIKPSIFAVVLLVVVSGYALLIEPLIGLADNGDFFRIMISNDLKHEEQRSINDFFGYFNNKYDKLQYYNELKGKMNSTHSIIIKGAMKLDDIFTRDQKFDIRFQAFICLAVLGIALYWLVESIEKMTHDKRLKYLFALIAVIIFGDIGYISYFNSFFGEAIAYPFYLLSISAMLRFSTEKDMKIEYLFLYFIGSFMFMGSKNQFSVNGILSFFLLVTLLFFKLKNYKKIVAVLLGIALLVSTAVMYVVIDDSIYLINKYHMITRGVTLFEPDPGKAIKEAGLNSQYSLLSETIYFDRTPVIHPKDELLLNNFYSQYDLFSITFYYFRNPDAFKKIMGLGWKNSFTIRPEVLGNFKRSSGKEFGTQARFFSLWSYIKDHHIPHNPGLILLFLSGCLVLMISRILKYKHHNRPQITYYTEMIMIYVFFTGFSQVLVSLIGAGDTDLKKHLFMTTVSLDILFYFNIVWIISTFHDHRENKIK